MNNYEGEERYLRLAALELAFEGVAKSHAVRVAFFVQTQSNDFRSETLSDDYLEAHQRSVALFNKIQRNIATMVRFALNFFWVSGSFEGFIDSADANKPRMLSLRDVDLIYKAMIDTSGLNGKKTQSIFPS